MTTLYYFMYGMAGIIEPFLWLKIFGKLYRKRYSERKFYFLGGLGLYIIFLVKQMISLNLEDDSINSISMILQIIYIFMMMKILYECKFTDRLMSIGLLAILSTVIDVVVLVAWVAICKRDLDELMQFGFMNASLTVLARCVETFILRMYLAKKDKGYSNGKSTCRYYFCNWSWTIYFASISSRSYWIFR